MTGVDASALDPASYRAAFRRHASGVVVVTAQDAGRPAGLTVTSLVSVSLEPPLVSFVVAAGSSAWPVLAVTDTVIVNFLAAEHEEIAVRFATSGIDRFAPPTRWSWLPAGEPLLLDAPMYLRCRVVHRAAVGDHYLVVARVIEAQTLRDHAPLVYHAGAYRSIVSDPDTG